VNEEIPSWGELASQLLALVDNRLLDPLEILLESQSELTRVRSRVVERAGAWASALLSEDDVLAQRTVIRLVITLFPGDAPFDPPAAWWQTPLGRVMARRAGHPGAEAVSYSVAGAMLGITRQGVHDLVNRGKLARHENGGVLTSSVQDRLNQRAAAHLRSRGEEVTDDSGQ
jgi:hypothetical protein